MADTLIVVPCYNEADRLPVQRFREFAAASRIRFLFVDDGSADRTLEILRALHAENPEACGVLALPRNMGKAEAVRRGVLAAMEDARTRYVGFWDADLATPLEAIADLRAVLEERPSIDVVMGARVKLLGRQIERHAWRHYLGRVFATATSMALRLPIYDTQCGAKLFRVSDRLAELFQPPFIARWIFDVELIARMIRQRRSRGLPDAGTAIYEFPLLEWRDVPGSKLKPWDFARAALDLASIYWTYLRRGAPALATPAPAASLATPHGAHDRDGAA
ncbi:MAG TPA: glycosyltransferase [Longimicrobiales bacterium]